MKLSKREKKELYNLIGDIVNYLQGMVIGYFVGMIMAFWMVIIIILD